MKETIIYENKRIEDRCTYGKFNRSIAKDNGLEAAVVLQYLLDCYDYYIKEMSIYKNINGKKAFYVMQNDLFSKSGIKKRRFYSKSKVNPFVRLEKNGLINRVVIKDNKTRKDMTFFILNFNKIDEATSKSNSFNYF